MKPTVMRSLGAVEPSAPSALEGMMTGAATNVAAVDLRNCRREIWFSFIKELSVRKSLLLPARFIGKGEDDDCVRITPHQSQVRQVQPFNTSSPPQYPAAPMKAAVIASTPRYILNARLETWPPSSPRQ